MENMKDQRQKNKVLFKLNNNLFSSNLPKLQDSNFVGKQNKSFTSPKKTSGFLDLTKKSVKLFNLPKKFKKHNNIVQDNITTLNKTSTQFYSSISKTCSSSFYKASNKIDQKSTTQYNFSYKMRSNMSIKQQQKNKNYMQPRTLQGIQREFQTKYQVKLENFKRQRQSEEMKKRKRIRISQDVSQIMKNNKNTTILSRFTLLQLKSYYYSILNFSKGDIHKFKYAFQIMLNLANVTVRQTIMNQCVRQLIKKGINFTGFLKTFTDIQQRLRKQAIIDYFQILLQQIKTTQISYEQLILIFEGRMKKQIATQLTQLLYQKMQKQFTDSINKKQIHELCYKNEQFCTKFYTLNHENMLSNKFDTIEHY